MRHVSIAFALFVSSAFADEKPKPNTLTPKEIADGWVLLFDGETTFGWKVEGEARVMDGRLVLGGKVKSAITCSTTFASCDLRVRADDSRGSGQITFIAGQEGPSIGIPAQPVVLNATVKTDDGKNSTSQLDLNVGPDGTAHLNATQSVGRPVTFRIETSGPGHELRLHSICARPSVTRPVFNGKDLTGWKQYDTAKAKRM
jgi:hypothetical protein